MTPSSGRESSSGLTRFSGLAHPAAVIIALGGVVVGVRLIMHTSVVVLTAQNGVFYAGAATVHPDVAVGIVVLVAGVLQGLTLMVIGRLGRAVNRLQGHQLVPDGGGA